ncbi:MAG: PAS domain-containing protein [Parachlamydiaceae bacterium]|nr:PAS domain-containing protein [Parachlamydiaceae bacterium]
MKKLPFSLRQKILISYLSAVLILMTVIYPLASFMVQQTVLKLLKERSSELIERIRHESNDYALVQRLKDQRALIFFRVSLITNERKLLYDSYTKRLLGPKFNQQTAVHPEVEQAFEEGTGFYEDDSKLLGQRFVYHAEAFEFQDKTYVLRTAFPFKFVSDLTHNVEFNLIALSSVALLLFSLMTWIILNRLTMPIQRIITTIKPYQDGRIQTLPRIATDASAYEDVQTLADTLNLLSTKIQSNIDILTQERNETSTVLESLVEGVIAIDQHQIVTYANQMALNLLGISREALFGKPSHLIHNDTCLQLLINCQQTHKILTETVEIRRQDQKFFLDVIAIPKANDSGAVLVMEDKSTHYKLLNMRKDFIANASHELKTPITIIRGFAETLHDHPDLPAETCAKITNKILQNCKRMSSLVKDLLVLTDIENIPHSRLIECDLHEVVQKCCLVLQDLYPGSFITINKIPEHEMFITGDPSLLEMAVMNLLENAAKYSHPPAKITVSLDHVEQRIQLKIADKGIGIPENDLEQIFHRFYTVNKAHSRKLGGSGLGLSIVETVVEKHGGDVSVASKLGEGSTFTISLPRI